ncbi:hypothetical protein RRG08_034601 [Elysia crispata]|uniref:Uncharacterized protein n=1 Tax=Elysia crispata TaxID=231223 RepID=A0AAE1B2L2_9GAST|nr:hypothetical protein RRG08_034601 [Elysia crispata]
MSNYCNTVPFCCVSPTVSSHDTALNTSDVVGDRSRDGDRDHDNDRSIDDNTNSNNTTNSSSITALPQTRRIIMDGDGDGAPSSSADSSPRHNKDEKQSEGGDGEEIGKVGVKSSTTIKFDDSSAESTPRRSKSAHNDRSSSGTKSPANTPGRGGQDLSSLDMKASWGESSTGGSSVKGSPSASSQDGQTGYKCSFKAGAGMLADPVKIAREREKEERVRQARERLMEERRKKLEELREQQRIAQENRERQLEQRRQKIEDLRRRDSERRAAVEERRRIKEETERARRESILQKAEERVARYEAWKAGGRKGGRGHVLGFGSATPRDICQRLERPRRSSSQSALGPRSPNGSDMGSVRPQRRALSACSAVRRHCCVDMNRMGTFFVLELGVGDIHYFTLRVLRPSLADGLVLVGGTLMEEMDVMVRHTHFCILLTYLNIIHIFSSFVTLIF